MEEGALELVRKGGKVRGYREQRHTAVSCPPFLGQDIHALYHF